MDLQQAENTFALRLYDWSVRDLMRELDEGCPLLSTLGLNNRRMAAFVAWNETLSKDERRLLARALTRRVHENAASLRGECLTAQDNYWHEQFYEQTTIYMNQLPPLATTDPADPNFRTVDPDRCLSTLVSVVSPVLGRTSRRQSKVICTRKMGDWKIITEFTFRRRDKSLVFEYQFIRKDGGPVETGHAAQGPFPRTMLFFYGVYESVVRVPSEADSTPMAKVMANLAAYFVSQAEPFFDGLGIDD